MLVGDGVAAEHGPQLAPDRVVGLRDHRSRPRREPRLIGRVPPHPHMPIAPANDRQPRRAYRLVGQARRGTRCGAGARRGRRASRGRRSEERLDLPALRARQLGPALRHLAHDGVLVCGVVARVGGRQAAVAEGREGAVHEPLSGLSFPAAIAWFTSCAVPTGALVTASAFFEAAQLFPVQASTR